MNDLYLLFSSFKNLNFGETQEAMKSDNEELEEVSYRSTYSFTCSGYLLRSLVINSFVSLFQCSSSILN
jgi:hypothetical protein